MADCQYRNFDLTVSGIRIPYAVTAVYRNLSAHGDFGHDAKQPVWQEYSAILSDLRRPPGESLLREMGSLLFDGLMRDEIRDLWHLACSEADDAGAPGLRLRLILHEPAVAALPWESLYDPRRQRVLGADARVTLVRRANRASYISRTRPLTAQLPVKVLVVAVNDSELAGELDLAGELANVDKLLAPLRPHKLELRTEAGELTIHNIRRLLVEFQPDIFHLISHGDTNGLLLWSNEGQPEIVTGGQFQTLIRQFPSLKLVFLNACLAGLPSGSAPFGNMAERLLQTGLPAVIAMQFEIADRAAVEFAGYLYEALAGGDCPGAVDRAVALARANLYISNPDQLDYFTPVLWLNAPDGVIFQLVDQPEVAEGARRGGEPTPAPRLDPGIAEKERWLASLPRYQRRKLAPVARIIYDAWQTDIREAGKWLERLRVLDAEQAQGHVRSAQIKEALDKFENERRKIKRSADLLRKNVGPGDPP